MPYPMLKEIDLYISSDTKTKSEIHDLAYEIFHENLLEDDSWKLHNAMEGLLRIISWLTDFGRDDSSLLIDEEDERHD